MRGAARFCCAGCRIAFEIAGAAGAEGQARWIHARFLLAALLAVAVMTQSMILYTEELYDAAQHPALDALVRWSLLALSAPVLLLLAPALLDPSQPGWRRLASLELWILTAVTAAWLLSAVRVLRGSGALYFDSAAMVLVIVTLGRYLDARARARVGEAAAALRRLLPERALRLQDGAGSRAARVEEVVVSEVRPGERVRVPAGQRAPLDGTVIAGQALADLSILTGEPAPRRLRPGDEVPAGALLLDGALDLRVSAAAGSRTLDRVAEALQQARARRTPSLRAADRLAGFLLPASLLLAAAALLGHGRGGDWDAGLSRALAILLVSCPCGLGLATPLATWSAIGAALRRGVLVRDGAALERLPAVRSFLFDKTGTLTTSERTVLRAACAGFAETEARAVAAALAAASRHPAARALCGAAAPPLPDSFQVLAGRGVAGAVAGRRFWLGNRALLQENGLELPRELESAWRQAEAEGRSAVALAEQGGERAAIFVLGETLRPEAAEAVASLLARGRSVEVLTGDSTGAAQALRQSLGVPVHAALLPRQKEEAVALAAEQRGPVLYFGDGVNDGPALARADVSATFGSGADVARSAADLVFLGEDLRALRQVEDLARRTRLRIRFNLFWALSYNPLFLWLAASGRLSPVLCALGMALSSLLVTTLSIAPPGREPSREIPPWTPSSKPLLSVS